ncbi:tetratricopeptide repeat protein [Glaciecola sp. 1036]|uniref:tetratricopeptide repeat protein n=1 Tax=Alteromonadaceae TaxID=72275 RepID=UPI003D0274C6
MKIVKLLSLFIVSIGLSLSAIATEGGSLQVSFDDELLTIQHQWAKVNYTLQDDAQEQAFEKLLAQASSFVANYPNKSEPLIWQGIIQSSYAGAKGGLGALSLAKAARDSLEKALKLDEKALDGSAYTSLGTLYHKVPGWPLGFGDDDEAKEMLEKAIALNPDGIDPNYFYGEYLFDEKQYDKALKHLTNALAAPDRATRPLADKYRREEIQQLLVKVNQKLNKSKS